MRRKGKAIGLALATLLVVGVVVGGVLAYLTSTDTVTNTSPVLQLF